MPPAPTSRAGLRPGIRYTFGPFALDPAEHVLLHDGTPIPARAKALDVLIVLVEHAGHLVTKAELMAAVWPGLAVEKNTVTVTVSRVRALLEDGGRHGQYIETVAGHGYRFVGAVEERCGTGPSADGVMPARSLTPALAAPVEPARASRRRRGLGVALAVVVVVGMGALAFHLHGVCRRERAGFPTSGPVTPALAPGPVASPTGASFQSLEDLPGGLFERAAYQVSADGAVVVGYGSSVTGQEAFLWTSAEGVQSLKTTLEAHGVPLPGWQLRAAYDVALSGGRLIVVGEGLNPSRQTEAWRAVLPWGRVSARTKRPALVR